MDENHGIGVRKTEVFLWRKNENRGVFDEQNPMDHLEDFAIGSRSETTESKPGRYVRETLVSWFESRRLSTSTRFARLSAGSYTAVEAKRLEDFS